jgi:hypothetical protein
MAFFARRQSSSPRSGESCGAFRGRGVTDEVVISSSSTREPMGRDMAQAERPAQRSRRQREPNGAPASFACLLH